jgi:hypothetical protein
LSSPPLTICRAVSASAPVSITCGFVFPSPACFSCTACPSNAKHTKPQRYLHCCPQQDLLLLDLPVAHGPNLSSPASTAHGPVSAQGVKVRSIAASSSDSSHLEIPQLPATPIVQLESHLDHWAFCCPIVILSALRFGTFHSIKLLFNAKSSRPHVTSR